MKIRNGFVSNSSSSSFVIVFNPNYNVDENGDKIEASGDSPFQYFIELYGQENYICETAESFLDHICEMVGAENVDELRGIKGDEFVDKIQNISTIVPESWHWAEVGVAEDVASRLLDIIKLMKDVDLTDEFDIDINDYDFENGYMIRIG